MSKTTMGRAMWVRVVCAVALVCVGLAHKPPVVGPAAAAPVELTQYAFPDGTLPVLCLPGDEDGTGGDGSNLCAACRLTADIVLPAPGEAGEWLSPPAARGVPPLRFEAFHRRVLPPNASPRAPPAGTAA